MDPNQAPSQPDPGNLEDRLRGLILSNANSNPDPAEPPVSSPYLPPHMLKASPEDKAEYIARAGSRPQGSSPASLPAGRQKRPNQAQRREMNSQTSIVIDPRSAHHTQPRRGPGFGDHSQSPQFHHGHQNRTPMQQHHFSARYQNPPPHPHTQSNPSQQQSFPPNGPHPPHQPGFRVDFSGQRPNSSNAQYGSRPAPQNRQLFQPGGPTYGQGRGNTPGQGLQEIPAQVSYLEKLIQEHVSIFGMDPKERASKEEFRATIEQVCREAIAEFERGLGNEDFDPLSVQIQCFGSMQSGFATRSSDMDLALLAPGCVPAADSAESRIPRLLEKNLLALGFGARLLTRTRVPIIKLCEKPTEKLLSSLREERIKWDNGVVDEDEDATHGADKDAKHPSVDGFTSPVGFHHQDSMATRNSHGVSPPDIDDSKSIPSRAVPADTKREEVCHSTKVVTDTGLQSPTAPQAPFTDEVYRDKLSSLKQQDQQSLQDYHNSAKRLLKKLGGRDITASSPTLDEDEKIILADVCRAFILGLTSKEISTRLQSYHSIKPLFGSSPLTNQRSLHAIWSLADGERFVMAWESRPFLEFNNSYESEASVAINAWTTLQGKTSDILSPAFFSRQLFAQLERLKKINSIQMMLLEQMPYEEPCSYFARAQRIQQTLRLRPENATKEELASFVVNKYIAGVNSPSIKVALENGTLQEVAREHIKLQLVADYERALGMGLFEDHQIPAVEQYITLLRSHKFIDHSLEPELVSTMRGLPDPTQVSILKPRDPYKDKLEFPKMDIGIQCDINFSAHLAIHNTLLLRCYAASDPRVTPMVLFIKHWAGVRGINTPYRGTLSSYGYVLMVLHYLVNLARPFVCPNLQLVNKDPPNYLPATEIKARSVCEGRDVRFWRNGLEIKNLADRGMLNHNKDPLGLLVRGFFEYYAQSGQMTAVPAKGFDWGREVLSLRTPGGILTKQEKGWTGAKTTIETSIIAAPPAINTGSEAKPSVKTMEETKEIRHRYLFAIEDPFELDHNIARTVTHNGIVSIRDEFRRAWRIIKDVGKKETEDLLALITEPEKKNGLKEAMDIIHGFKTGA